jgi:TMEM175 potassium channel family protein
VGKGRLEAFSDGVLAIIITIMVLELKVPHEASLEALRPIGPLLVGYVVSFTFVGIYWNNHHHLIHLVKQVNGRIMWANLHLLFWLSLLPVTTGWVGEHPHAPWPVAAYGIVLFISALAYLLLQSLIIRGLPNQWKDIASPALYLSGIGLAFVSTWIAEACYVAVAIIWIVPDRRLANAAHGADE